MKLSLCSNGKFAVYEGGALLVAVTVFLRVSIPIGKQTTNTSQVCSCPPDFCYTDFDNQTVLPMIDGRAVILMTLDK